MYKYIVINTAIGELIVVWDTSIKKIEQIVLPNVNSHLKNTSELDSNKVIFEDKPPEKIRDFTSRLKKAVLGKNVKFDLDCLDLSILSDFQKKVLLKQAEIPHGKVTTYKYLSQMLDFPNSARPIGNVLSNNPFPIVIPCHRTVKSDWHLGGYGGTNKDVFKRILLCNEKVQLEHDVIKEEYRYIPE